jgi:hypothetical protein
MIGWVALAVATPAAPAQAAEKVAPPAAIVRGHTVRHPVAHLTVRVPKTATYIGRERFDLYGVADAEIEVFADVGRNKRLTRLYWIQFESYWPDKPDLTYNYTTDRRERHWGTTVWVNDGPGSTRDRGRPGSDREHVQTMIERAGYTIPDEMMNVRMVQILDDPKGTGHGRRELMFIYAEDLAKSGKTLAEWQKAPDAAWAPVGKPLVQRAVTAFEVMRR